MPYTADTLTLKVDGPGTSILKVYPQTDKRNLSRIAPPCIPCARGGLKK